MTDFTTFCHDVRVVCTVCDGSITSWGRTEQRNAEVGGHENSWHRWKRGGLAVDIVFDQNHDQHLASQFFKLLGYEVVEYESHLHIEPTG